jgi:hypothetical protein
MNLIKEMLDAIAEANKMKNRARERAISVMKNQVAMDRLIEEYIEARCRFEEHADTCAFEVTDGTLCTEGEGLLTNSRELTHTVALVTLAYMDLVKKKQDGGLAIPRMTSTPRHPRVSTAFLALSVTPYMSY